MVKKIELSTELSNRQDFIKKDKIILDELREKQSKLRGQLANLNYDVITFPDRVDFKQRQNQVQTEVTQNNEKIHFYTNDINTAEVLLKRDIRDFRQEERRRWRADLQIQTLPAERNQEDYNKGELIDMVQIEHDDDLILLFAKKYKRTWYAVEHVVRSKEYYLNKHRLPASAYQEPYSKLLEETIKLVYKI